MGEKFEVRDRRTMDAQGNLKEAAAHAGKAPETAPREKEQEHTAAEEKTAREGRHARHEEGHAHGPHGPDFLSFMVNLAGMAYMTMGLGEVPTEPNIPEARYIIDSMDMLKEKTKGNLSPDEEKGLTGLLYELKMNFSKVASVASGKPSSR